MTEKEAKSCIGTIEMLRRLAYNIHGVMDVIDADNCEKIIKALEQEPCEDAIRRADAEALFRNARSKLNPSDYKTADEFNTRDLMLLNAEQFIHLLPSVRPQEPKTGHWMRKTKVDGVYDIAGVKTWGVKCQCDKCDFTTTVIEDFGYYKYCPNCGAKMIEPQESEEMV